MKGLTKAGALAPALVLCAVAGLMEWDNAKTLDRTSYRTYEGFLGSSGKLSTSSAADTVSVFWTDDRGDQHDDMPVSYPTFKRIVFGSGSLPHETVYVRTRLVGRRIACAGSVFDECAAESRWPLILIIGSALLGLVYLVPIVRAMRRARSAS
jgi:hypothetical protein